MPFIPSAHKYVGDSGKPAQIITYLMPNDHIPSTIDGVSPKQIKRIEPNIEESARPRRTLVDRLFETFMFWL